MLMWRMSSPKPAPALAGNVIGSNDGDFIVAEWSDPGSPPGPPRLIAPPHIHHGDDEAWYVVEGVLHVQRGDEVVEVRAGSAVLVSKGTVHTYWNPSTECTRYLLIMTPNIYRLIQEIHALEERTPAALQALFAKHDSELC
jgi:mannose-6-phosphate isomerase-like protein (cupin superfamily)